MEHPDFVDDPNWETTRQLLAVQQDRDWLKSCCRDLDMRLAGAWRTIERLNRRAQQAESEVAASKRNEARLIEEHKQELATMEKACRAQVTAVSAVALRTMENRKRLLDALPPHGMLRRKGNEETT